jgi:SPP1 family predicted phage head-tail adaptor
MAGSGYWRDLFLVESPTSVADALGQASTLWTTVGYIRGQVRPSQREVMDDLGNAVRTDLELETAFHPGLTARCRLTLNGVVYNVSSVTDPDSGRRRRLRVVCTEVMP